MLKTRILTAILIFVVTVALVFLPPSWLFSLIVALLLILACWEFRKLADLANSPGWVLQGIQFITIALMIYYWPFIKAMALPILAAACLSWIFMFSRLYVFRDNEKPDTKFRRISFLSALGSTVFCWFSLAWLHDQPSGPFIVFLLLLTIWASDVGAYFSGRQFGRRKLAPVISPKKTWEGVYGGIALAIAAAFLWAWVVAVLAVPAGALVVITALTALASVGGDLFISIHKRTVGLKDTGSIFPGHGGVLDRYDSLLAGAPFFALAFGVLAQ